ncbi:MbtH family protein [Micromonospora echinofusca]|uniref:MbtH family NRPS accessory protein n=1 Tax=Micromonospora echinofusca TaxID=47858 RepID=A0ABS3VNH1_MICEH|nr:MbtH family NRPS accessory protein [Micromonospora echinofusca]MBO4205924.1 MbtH family NRPS accessory protein [Micromonospora echinofusca]
MSNETAEVTHAVVVNDEEQYSVWWADRDLPAGWRKAGFEGTRADCLAHIEQVWSDLRPRSLRERMATSA